MGIGSISESNVYNMNAIADSNRQTNAPQKGLFDETAGSLASSGSTGWIA